MLHNFEYQKCSPLLEKYIATKILSVQFRCCILCPCSHSIINWQISCNKKIIRLLILSRHVRYRDCSYNSSPRKNPVLTNCCLLYIIRLIIYLTVRLSYILLQLLIHVTEVFLIILTLSNTRFVKWKKHIVWTSNLLVPNHVPTLSIWSYLLDL